MSNQPTEPPKNLAPLDRGVRIVSATGQCDYDEDESLPYKVVLKLRPPEFMIVTFVMLHGGTEEIIARGETLDAIEDFLKRNDLETHPRFRSILITGPDGVCRSKGVPAPLTTARSA